jgi:hypothetical protein
MSVGYARVLTPEQKLDLQLDVLQQAGCERVYMNVDRPPVRPADHVVTFYLWYLAVVFSPTRPSYSENLVLDNKSKRLYVLWTLLEWSNILRPERVLSS